MKKSTKNIIITLSSVALCTVIIAIAFLIARSLNGETTISETDAQSVNSQILTCSSSTKEYPFFSYDNSDKKDLEIDLRFVNDILQSASLKYTLYYGDSEEISKSSAHNHAAMDKSFYADGLEANSFEAYYSELSNAMRMTLYADKNDFDRTAAKYFMLNISDNDKMPSKLSEFRNNYKVGGFKC